MKEKNVVTFERKTNENQYLFKCMIWNGWFYSTNLKKEM